MTPGFRGWETLSVVGPIADTVADARAAARRASPAPTRAIPASLPAARGAARRAGRRRASPRASTSATCRSSPVVRAAFAAAIDEMRGRRVAHRGRRAGADPERAAVERDRGPRGLRRRPRPARAPASCSRPTPRGCSPRARRHGAEYLDALDERAPLHPRLGALLRRLRRAADADDADDRVPGRACSRPTAIDGVPVDPFFDDWCGVLPAREPDRHAGHVGALRLRRGRPADRSAGDGRARRGRLDAAVAEAWEALFAPRRRTSPHSCASTSNSLNSAQSSVIAPSRM